MEEEDKNEYEFKIITLGDPGVGKTSIIKRYIYDEYNFNEISTMGIQFSFKDINIKGKNIKLNILDTGGQEKFKSLSSSYLKHADVVLFVFDWSVKKTFENMKMWINHFEENNNGKKIKQKLLIGNKSDLQLNVDKNEVNEFAKNNNLVFMSTSAKYKDQIDELFKVIGINLYDYIQNKIQRKETNSTQVIRDLSSSSNRKKKCCN